MFHYPIRLTGAAIVAVAIATLSGTAARAADISGSTVAFLMPDQGSTRYEEHDHPGFVAEMKKLCDTCKVIYLNADTDAAKQQQQFNSVIAQGAKVIVLDPVDSSAAASLVHNAQSQGVKVIAYDRPIPDAKADFYVSFNNEAIGKAIASSLVELLKSKGVSADGEVGVLQINGSPTDAAAGLIKKEIHGDSPRARIRRWPSSTRRTGSRATPNNGRLDRSRDLAAKSSASWRQTTGPAAALSRRLKRPASIRFRQ